ALAADTGEVLGLAGQILHRRPRVPKKEGVAAKRARASRESRRWVDGARARGPIPEGARDVDVADRGGDALDVVEAEAAPVRGEGGGGGVVAPLLPQLVDPAGARGRGGGGPAARPRPGAGLLRPAPDRGGGAGGDGQGPGPAGAEGRHGGRLGGGTDPSAARAS